MPLQKNTPHPKTSVPFLSSTATPTRIPHRLKHICKAVMFLQHCRHSSCARQEKDAGPQENDPPHSWLQVEFLQGKLSHSSIPPSPLLLLSSFSPSSRAEGAHNSCPNQTPVPPLASKPRWRSGCSWLECGREKGVATVFTACKPEAAASRLCEACWCFPWRGLVCLRQHSCWQQQYLVTVFGTGAQLKKKNSPIFYWDVIRNIWMQINSLWCWWIFLHGSSSVQLIWYYLLLTEISLLLDQPRASHAALPVSPLLPEEGKNFSILISFGCLSVFVSLVCTWTHFNFGDWHVLPGQWHTVL